MSPLLNKSMVQVRNSVIIIGTFLIYKNSKYVFAYLFFGVDKWKVMDPMISMALVLATGMIMAFVAVWLTTGSFRLESLGMGKGLVKGALLAFICTIPMFAGYACLGELISGNPARVIYRDMVLAGFGEELMFRAFLFGLLYHAAGWGFIPATLLSAVIFASGHLYQADDLSGAIAIFAFTTLASAGFSWMYLAWNSLWFVAFLHGFMDLSWSLFSIPDDVTGSAMVNAFRGLTILAAVLITIKQNQWKPRGKWWKNDVRLTMYDVR